MTRASVSNPLRRLGRLLALGAAFALGASSVQAQPVRIKDLGKLSGWRENALVGYGLVTGLAGTGDSSRNQATRQSLANMLSRFDLTISPDDVNSRNVAAVMVTASLPAFARAGDVIDVSVNSVGDARSLVGGTLMLAPLKAANGRIYALAQGAVLVGGYRYDANGNQVQKNHPTVGAVAGGARVEVGLAGDEPASVALLTFVLQDPDYTTANRIANAINARLGSAAARVRDAAGVDISVPADRQSNLAPLVTALEEVSITPDRRARVVINERTGTVVTGGDVRIERVAVSHGDLKVTVTTENAVSQPVLVRQTGADVRTQGYSNSQLAVDDRSGSVFLAANNNTVADLVQALSKMRVNTRDVISILQAVKSAGALHAELVVQ
jgi:flagellar P-ring protein precursor FlgI